MVVLSAYILIVLALIGLLFYNLLCGNLYIKSLNPIQEFRRAKNSYQKIEYKYPYWIEEDELKEMNISCRTVNGIPEKQA